MADAIEGMKVNEAKDLIVKFKQMITEDVEVEFPEELEDLEALSGVKKFPVRVKCATLSWNTLEQALKNYAK
jgi:nitrogen fixation NifU-like protein